jgi:hypothetical protein
MTMNAWFFIAVWLLSIMSGLCLLTSPPMAQIILGIIVGETAFGRFYVRGFGGYIQTQRC